MHEPNRHVAQQIGVAHRIGGAIRYGMDAALADVVNGRDPLEEMP